MADFHELIVTCIIFLYQITLIFRSIHPFKKDAMLLILHNFLLYYVINMFKHLAQASINSDGAVNSFYYVPLVYEEGIAAGRPQSWHEVLRTSTWHFFEVLFRHHLALLLPFNLALLVPRCKLAFISTLVLLSNFVLFVCFALAICQLLLVHGHAHSLRLLTVLCLGPVCQGVLVCRLLGRMWLSQ
ncbi:uncharacterized protein LOC6542369 isoform X2 [Drosophila erecta]|uniref:Uncharacterized protein, isoform A n=1 Tax=Drosophila erecta TaxID=7220 RepID=B3N5L8_DROER|nr:uncharacterized protein LOC6542369 isoform X2 [Drosophila erecta]EDV57977.2 uncharacterized protein Dere_GG24236, isoform A [Drosophila erecta]